MAKTEWHSANDLAFETGLDKGVLYLPDGSSVPWNGLTQINENFNSETEPVYFDGMKINDLVTLGDFEATLTAMTYPDEFMELEGLVLNQRPGVFLGSQPPKAFGLCYRTLIGNRNEGIDYGYKLHLLYNVTAIPNEKTYASFSADPVLTEFSWSIKAVPEDVPGFRPTAHAIIDSRYVDPLLLGDLEDLLYGTSEADGVLLPLADLIELLANWFRVEIIDNGDGTWTARADKEGFIHILPDDLFTLTGVNAVYLNATTYRIASTTSIHDVPNNG